MVRFELNKTSIYGKEIKVAPFEGENGKGETGQVKKGSLFGRSIKIGDKKLNRGSLIDYINKNQADYMPKLKKGFLGIRASSDDEIIERLDSVLSKIAQKKFDDELNNNPDYVQKLAEIRASSEAIMKKIAQERAAKMEERAKKKLEQDSADSFHDALDRLRGDDSY